MIKVIDYTHKPLTIMGTAAAECWGSKPSPSIGIDCIESNHGRVLEYPDVIVKISGYSARAIRELYTHIVGISRLQSSTRYIDETGFDYFIPPKIEADEMSMEVYTETMNTIQSGYKTLLENGIRKEDAANVLPLGMDTVVVLKINARALLHLAEIRLCNRAYHEMRKLVQEMLQTIAGLDEEWAIIVSYCKPKCITAGYCVEKHCCGMMPKKEEVLGVYEKFKAFKKNYRDVTIDDLIEAYTKLHPDVV